MSDLRPGTTMYRIAELERVTRGQRQDIRELRAALELAGGRLAALERSAPEARQLQHEADVAAADLAESGYDRDPPIGADRHGPGCACTYCYDESEPEPDEYDPGPEVDDDGGMSGYRYPITATEEPL